MLTGKKANNGRTVSFSHIRNKTLQQVNLQVRDARGRWRKAGGNPETLNARATTLGDAQDECVSERLTERIFYRQQYKRIYWPEQKRYVRLRISTNALKTLNKLGLEEMAKRAGLDLASLPYIDADPERKQWLAENGSEPVKQNKRAPKGPKPLYIPKWKEAKLAKMDASAAAAEKKRFAEANNMIVA